MAVKNASSWLEKLKKAEKTCVINHGRRKIHYQLPEGEMVEEYDVKTGLLTVRKWRNKSTIGGLKKWEFEIGEPPVDQSLETEGIKEDITNAFFYRVDTECEFQWKIRNLPYSLSNYEVTASNNLITIKTLNKKYYKTFTIPDLERCGLSIDAKKLQVTHSSNTLKITYKKPPEILAMEKDVRQELIKLKTVEDENPDNCKPS